MTIGMRFWRGLRRLLWLGAALGCAALPGCRDVATRPPSRTEIAQTKFKERCNSAGERIHKTVQDVEGIFLMNLRPTTPDFDSQFTMDDPYGSDLSGNGYIESFLQGSFEIWNGSNTRKLSYPAYLYVEAIDTGDGKRYRYTGRVEEPGLTDPSYTKGTLVFVLDKRPAPGPHPRYGVQFADISTRGDREYWIAGSSLKVIDLDTNSVIAERIGYMWDPGQGSTEGGRSPWLFAARSVCPDFGSKNSSLAQLGQTERFVKKSLIPRTTDKRND